MEDNESGFDEIQKIDCLLILFIDLLIAKASKNIYEKQKRPFVDLFLFVQKSFKKLEIEKRESYPIDTKGLKFKFCSCFGVHIVQKVQ